MTLVPIRLPATRLSGPAPYKYTPAPVLPEIRLPAPVPGDAVSPPMVLAEAGIDDMDTTVSIEPSGAVAQRDCPGHISADKVALDDVVVCVVDLHAGIRVGGDDVAGRGRRAADRVGDERPTFDQHAVGTRCPARPCPSLSVPMRLPATRLPVEAGVGVLHVEFGTPSAVLPKITLPSHGSGSS